MNIISIRIIVALCWIYAVVAIDYSPQSNAQIEYLPSTDKQENTPTLEPRWKHDI